METPIIIVILMAVGLCLAWFGFKILKMVVKVAFVVIVVAVLGFLVYQIMLS